MIGSSVFGVHSEIKRLKSCSSDGLGLGAWGGLFDSVPQFTTLNPILRGAPLQAMKGSSKKHPGASPHLALKETFYRILKHLQTTLPMAAVYKHRKH